MTIEAERIHFSDLCKLYERRKKRKRSWKDDYQRMQFWLEEFALIPPHKITTTAIEDKLEVARRERHWSPATLNRYRSVINCIFGVAHFEGLIRSKPGIQFVTEKSKMTRYLRKSDARKLLGCLQVTDPMLAAMVQFSLATGLRQGNVVRLRWDWIDLEGRMVSIPADEAKSGVQLDLPMNDSAVSAVYHAQALVGDGDLVFPGADGKPKDDCATTVWRQALKDVGINRFRWHDLRHTWATWHAQGGTPLAVIMKLGGWSSYSSVLRYAKYLPETTQQYAHNSSL